MKFSLDKDFFFSILKASLQIAILEGFAFLNLS